MGELRGDLYEVLEQVDFVVAMHVLQHSGQTFQPHAGIDAWRRQLRECAVGRAIELHEDEVPDLDEAIAVLVGRSRRTAGNFRAVVVEDFRARSAGAGIGHLPEIVGCERRALVVADAHDALRRQADFLVPQIVGLVVGLIDRHQQAILRQLEHAGQKLPRPVDRFALEVVAEGPVAEHFEECVVARGIADRVEIVVLAAGAQTPLHVGRTHVVELFAAEEHVLELDHPRVREQQRRIVAGHERRRRHDRVALGLEEVEKGLADFGAGFHRDDQVFEREAPGPGAAKRAFK